LGRGVNNPPRLARRLKKKYSYTSTPPLGLRVLLQVDLYLYFLQALHFHKFSPPHLRPRTTKAQTDLSTKGMLFSNIHSLIVKKLVMRRPSNTKYFHCFFLLDFSWLPCLDICDTTQQHPLCLTGNFTSRNCWNVTLSTYCSCYEWIYRYSNRKCKILTKIASFSEFQPQTKAILI